MIFVLFWGIIIFDILVLIWKERYVVYKEIHQILSARFPVPAGGFASRVRLPNSSLATRIANLLTSFSPDADESEA